MFFGILDLQNIAKTYILQCKIAFLDFQEAPKKSMSFWRFLGAAKKVCDPACGLLGGRGRVGSGRSR